ncbi:MAG TPA: PilN domain-containing protein, partial [Acidobacteriota bacterium]|nr:PilN domain-containing protein [Acidobacteriota bacterium]
ERAELEELAGLFRGRQTVLLVLRDLTQRLPEDTYLQNLQIQGDQVTMQGYSPQASALLPMLMQSPYLDSVKTNWIQQDARQGGLERFNFTARIKSGPVETR